MIQKIIIICILGVVLNVALTSSAKIGDDLWETLATKGKANVVISFHQETHRIIKNVGRMRFESRGHKITFIKAQLEQLAEESQQNIISVLRSQSLQVEFQSFWISNKISVKDASVELIQTIAANPEVKEIREEKVFNENGYDQESIPASTNQEESGWGVRKIEADQAWNLVGGNTGEGVVVGCISSGARHTHEALSGNFRTPYGWFDPYQRRPNPSDDYGRGTHSLGIIVGSHGVGVAPGAQWAVCKGCTSIQCTETALIKCGEWMFCPTLPNSQSPDCSKAPNVVTNFLEPGESDSYYVEVVNAWRAANIIPVFGMGGTGLTSCRGPTSPGDYENVIGVGATARVYSGINLTETEGTIYYSARGPTTDGRLKPDVSAPGSVIKSACTASDSDYCEYSGTNNAAGHVAGTLALLLSRNPALTYDQIKNLLQDNADHDLRVADPVCSGDDNSTVFPNNIYGHGRINARRALSALISGA